MRRASSGPDKPGSRTSITIQVGDLAAPSNSRVFAGILGRQTYPSSSSIRQVARWTVGSSSTTSMSGDTPKNVQPRGPGK